jgi:DNA-binding NtrC family response regulator
VHLHIPPLRDRTQDIPRLLNHFVEKYGRRYGWSAQDLSPEIVGRFLTYDWPGNIRELENLVRRLMVLRDPSYVLAELRSRTQAQGQAASASGASGQPGAPGGATDGAEPKEFTADLKAIARKAAHAAEREAILTMLAHTAGNKREAAERLGISYKAILYKIREYGIGRPRTARRPILSAPATAAAAVPLATPATAPATAAETLTAGPTPPLEMPTPELESTQPATPEDDDEIDVDEDGAAGRHAIG